MKADEQIIEEEEAERPLEAHEKRVQCSQCLNFVIVRFTPSESRRKFWSDPATAENFLCEPCLSEIRKEQKRQKRSAS